MWGWSYLTTILISVAKFTEWKIKIFNKIFPWIAFLVEYIWVFLVSLVTRSEIESWENTVSILAGVLNASFGRVHSLVNRLNLDLTRPLQQFNTFYWSIWINYFYSWKFLFGNRTIPDSHNSHKSSQWRRIISWRFTKAGRGVVWWRTRDSRATCHNRVTVTKRESFLKSPRFLRSSRSEINWMAFSQFIANICVWKKW